MASKSGRRGDFTPESKEMMESTMQLDDDDQKEAAAGVGYGKRPSQQQQRRRSKSPEPSGRSSSFHDGNIAAPAKKQPAAASTTNMGSPGGVSTGAEGCKVCHRDDDHENLLLCETCNDEYHTYCLTPPLQSVPEGDFFCGEFLDV